MAVPRTKSDQPEVATRRTEGEDEDDEEEEEEASAEFQQAIEVACVHGGASSLSSPQKLKQFS